MRTLAAVEHVVADRELDDLDADAAVVLGDARVDSLVAPAGDDDLVGAREVLHARLSQRRAGRRRNREDATRRGRGTFVATAGERNGQYIVQGTCPHIGTHHHARATAVGSVIDAAMLAGGPIAQIVRLQMHETGVLRFPHQRQAKGRKIVRENRDEIEAHSVSRPRAPTPRHRQTSREARR